MPCCTYAPFNFVEQSYITVPLQPETLKPYVEVYYYENGAWWESGIETQIIINPGISVIVNPGSPMTGLVKIIDNG